MSMHFRARPESLVSSQLWDSSSLARFSEPQLFSVKMVPIILTPWLWGSLIVLTCILCVKCFGHYSAESKHSMIVSCWFFITVPQYFCDGKGCLSHTDGLIELTLWKTRDPGRDTLKTFQQFRLFGPTILNGARSKQGSKAQFNACLIKYIPSHFPLGHID